MPSVFIFSNDSSKLLFKNKSNERLLTSEEYLSKQFDFKSKISKRIAEDHHDKTSKDSKLNNPISIHLEIESKIQHISDLQTRHDLYQYYLDQILTQKFKELVDQAFDEDNENVQSKFYQDLKEQAETENKMNKKKIEELEVLSRLEMKIEKEREFEVCVVDRIKKEVKKGENSEILEATGLSKSELERIIDEPTMTREYRVVLKNGVIIKFLLAKIK